MPGLTYNQGDIVLIPFPFSDLSNSKVRPAVVISNALVNNATDIICAQITSQLYGDDFSFEIDIADLTIPLPKYSEVRCHKIFTADKVLIRKQISRLHLLAQVKLLEKIKGLL